MNMCPRTVCKSNVNVVTLLIRRLFKMLVSCLIRILKLPIYHLLWFATLGVLFYVFWNSQRHVKPPATRTKTNQSAGDPVILWWKSDFPATSTYLDCSDSVKCKVFSSEKHADIGDVKAFLFYASNVNFSDLPLPRRPKDIIWGLYHEESPRNVEELMHEQTLRLFNFTSTFSRHSNVPFPLQHLQSKEDITSVKYFVPTLQKNMYLKEIAPVMFLQTDCETSTERDAYVEKLMNYIDIDSYGACLNNKQLPEKFTKNYLNNLYEEEFLKFIARYKFVIAIENGVCYDYITEKFWRPITVGTVPIYFGSPSIRDWLPNTKSAILLEDFPSPKRMADHLMKLLDNDTLYEQYVEHKTKERITNRRLIEELNVREYQLDPLKVIEKFECFICEKLHKSNDDNERGVANENHYSCPKPISALTFNVNPLNHWVQSWYAARTRAEKIYEKVMGD